MQSRLSFAALASAFACAMVFGQLSSFAQDSTAAAEIKAAEAAFAKAFEAGKVEEVMAHFSPTAEFIDEEGNLYRGTKELTEMFAGFFKQFPGSKLSLEVESVREIGANLAMEEGTRYIETKDAAARATLRYSAVRTKVGGKWLFASVREFTADPLPTPHDQLSGLSWLVGEWINEGTDGVVKLSFKWSEDKNYILGEYNVTIAGKTSMNSQQRIGWDPINGRVRSWLFDSDGGFSEGYWTEVEDGWVIKSESTNPDATSGSATITLLPANKGQFVMKGSDRIVAGARAEDFEFTIVRKPPAATPGTGAAPATGTRPATGAAPATPVKPATPATPVKPATPGTPARPATPAKPATPATK
jgi:uncharacterized protein (TIGR02246 family)